MFARAESAAVSQHQPSPQCQMYLFLTVGVASAFFLATVVFVVAVLAKKRNHQRSRSISRSSSPVTSCVSITPVTTVQRDNTDAKNGKMTQLLQSYSAAHGFRENNSFDSLSEESASGDDRECEEQFSWLPPPQMLVPATVRHRKRQLNNELLDTFRNGANGSAMTLPSYPALMNYYGYMVVPRTAPAATANNKSNKSNTAPSRRVNTVNASTTTISNNGSCSNISIIQTQDQTNLHASASDDEDRQSQRRTQRQRYKRRQQHGDRTRARSVDARDSTVQTDDHISKNKEEQHLHQIKIDVPPPPPPDRTLHPPRPTVRRHYQENFYEVPIECKPVMV